MKKEGFSSIEFLITLFFLSTLILAFIFYMKTADFSFKKKLKNIDERELIDNILLEIYSDLKSDSTPEADSKNDRVWLWNEIEKDGYKIYISSLSGKINLNTIRNSVLNESGLRFLFNDSDGISFLNEKKQNGELVYSFDELKEFISEENFNKAFTLYGFANINISDENSIKIIADKKSKSSYGNILYDRSKVIHKNKQYIQKDTDLKMLLGVTYDDIFPYINIEPQINVNLVDEDLLNALLLYPGLNIPNKNKRINTLISLRDSKELNETDICNILGISKTDELYYYLGCKTLFWQIDIVGKNVSCSVVLARGYENDSSGKVSYYIIEKKWL